MAEGFRELSPDEDFTPFAKGEFPTTYGGLMGAPAAPKAPKGFRELSADEEFIPDNPPLMQRATGAIQNAASSALKYLPGFSAPKPAPLPNPYTVDDMGNVTDAAGKNILFPNEPAPAPPVPLAPAFPPAPQTPGLLTGIADRLKSLATPPQPTAVAGRGEYTPPNPNEPVPPPAGAQKVRIENEAAKGWKARLGSIAQAAGDYFGAEPAHEFSPSGEDVARAIPYVAPFPGVISALQGKPPITYENKPTGRQISVPGFPGTYAEQAPQPVVDKGALLNPFPEIFSDALRKTQEGAEAIVPGAGKLASDVMMNLPFMGPELRALGQAAGYARGRLFGDWGKVNPEAAAKLSSTEPLRDLSPEDAASVESIVRQSSDTHIQHALNVLAKNDPRYAIYAQELARRQAGGTPQQPPTTAAGKPGGVQPAGPTGGLLEGPEGLAPEAPTAAAPKPKPQPKGPAPAAPEGYTEVPAGTKIEPLGDVSRETPDYTKLTEPPEVSQAAVDELKRGLAEEKPVGVPPSPLTPEQQQMAAKVPPVTGPKPEAQVASPEGAKDRLDVLTEEGEKLHAQQLKEAEAEPKGFQAPQPQSAFEAGKAAFVAGQPSQVPIEFIKRGEGESWAQGWHQANIDQPETTRTEPAKEPWQMTKAEWMKQRPAGTSPGMHEGEVEKAVREGKTVPPEVLAEYTPEAKAKVREDAIAKAKERVSKAHDWTEVGKNEIGQTLYEDQNGVRSYIENGVRTTEAVPIRPTRGGVEVIKPEHKDEWRLATEITPKPEPKFTIESPVGKNVETTQPAISPREAAKAQATERVEKAKETKPKHVVTIKAQTFHDQPGFHIYDREGRSIFTKSRESADRIKAKIQAGQDIESADFAETEVKPEERAGHARERIPSTETAAKPESPTEQPLTPRGAAKARAEQRVKQTKEAKPPEQSQTVEAGANNVEAEIKEVAKIEGKRPAKELKAEIIKRVEALIKAAPSKADIDAQAKEIRSTKPSNVTYNGALSSAERDNLIKSNKAAKEAWEKENRPKLERLEEGQKITIDIPGDGKFTILRTKEALSEFLAEAKKIQTTAGVDPAKFKPGKVPIPKRRGNLSADLWYDSSDPTHFVTNNAGVKLKGMEIKIPELDDVPLFVTSGGESYQIIEPRSGLAIGDSANTIAKAAENAKTAYKEANAKLVEQDKPSMTFKELAKAKIEQNREFDAERRADREVRESIQGMGGNRYVSSDTIKQNPLYDELYQKYLKEPSLAKVEEITPESLAKFDREREGKATIADVYGTEETPAAEESAEPKKVEFTKPVGPSHDSPYINPDADPGLYARDAYVESRVESAMNNPADPDYGVMKNYLGLKRLGEWEKEFRGRVEDQWFDAQPKERTPPEQPSPPPEGGKKGGAYGYPEPETQGFPEFRKTPKDVPQSVSPMERNYKPPTSPAEAEKIVRRGDIIRAMQERLQVPIRIGHGNFAQMKAAGFFKVKEEVIRLKKANNMETAAHEVGHFISKRFLGRRANRLPGHAELVRMGKDLYGSRKPNGGYAEEGVAEFVKFYVTNPGVIPNKAPKFSAYFEEVLNKNPDLRDTLNEARDSWKRYQEQPAAARVLSQVSVGEKKPRPITLDGLYKAALDDLHYIKVFEDRMNKGKAPLNASDSPYTLARLFRGWTGRAELFLKDGPIDYDTYRPVQGVKPLNEILAPFSKNLDDLRAYLVARRAAELMTRGKETGLAASDVQATLDAYNNKPQFLKAAEDLQKYNNALLDYLQKSGVISKKGVEAIKANNQEYVPFYRVIEGETRGSGMAGSQRFGNLGNPVKGIKGSSREIIDPLESIVKNTYAMINVADRNAVAQALVNLAEKNEGMGKYIEKVPRSKIPVTLKDEDLHRILARYGRMKQTETFQTSKKEFTRESGMGAAEGAQPTTKGQALIEGRVMEALKSRGFTEGESKLYVDRLKSAKTDAVVNSIIEKIVTEQTIKTVTKELELDLPPEVAAAFRPDPKIPGMDHIVSVKKDGKAVLYEVHPDLYESMAGLDRNSSNILIKILSMPARALRLGATVLSPEFVVRNPVRDQWTAAMYSKYGIVNFPGGDLIRGLFHILQKDDLYNAWKAGGGEGSMLVSLDRGSLQKTLKEVIDSGKVRGIAKSVIIHPIDSLRALSEFGEAATRVGEFAKTISYEGGLTKENILRGAMEAREITLDFARMGSAMKASGLNQIVAFLNANLQGLDKMRRFAGEHPWRFIWRGLATITIPSLLLYLMNQDDPRYDELPAWQKNLFWIIPTGTMDHKTWAKMSSQEKATFNNNHTIWRIPKPFDVGLLFGTLPERALDWINKNDPKALPDFIKSFLSTLPNPIPTAAIPLIENMANWSMFRERRIIPRGKEDVEPARQYTPGTSEAAKALGGVAGYSPAKIENLLRGYFGGMGQVGLDVSSKLLKKGDIPEPAGTMADVPLVRGFVARFPGQPQSVERFYEKYSEALEKKATYDMLRRERKIEDANQYRKDNHDALAKVHSYMQVAKQLSNLRKTAERIAADKNLTPDAKRIRIDALTFRMTDVARKAAGTTEGLRNAPPEPAGNDEAINE